MQCPAVRPLARHFLAETGKAQQYGMQDGSILDRAKRIRLAAFQEYQIARAQDPRRAMRIQLDGAFYALKRHLAGDPVFRDRFSARQYKAHHFQMRCLEQRNGYRIREFVAKRTDADHFAGGGVG
jgi:hypothetical protein